MEEEDLLWSDAALNKHSSTLIPGSLAPPSSSSSSSFLEDAYYSEDYDYENDYISSLSETQDKVLSVLPLLSGLLSAYGSANIIWMVYRSKPSTRNCYKRLLFGLSCSDFVSSTILGFQPFLLPASTSNRLWAIGTNATCSMMGFFQQLSLSNIWYNGMLSFYFLFTIRYGIQMTTTTVGWRETTMHVVSVGIPLVTAVVGLAMGLYGELRVGHFCYFTGPPLATHIAFGVAGLPGFFFFLAIPINNLLVYCHVRKQVSNKRRRRRRREWKSQTVTAAKALGCRICCGGGRRDKLDNGDPPPEQNTHDNIEPTMISISMSGRTAMTRTTTTSSAATAATDPPQQLEEQQQREHKLEQQRQQLQQTREQKRIQQVAFQAFLYVAAYFVSYLPTAILRVIAAVNSMNASNEARLFPLLVAQAILWPLQGLFNYVIYCRSPSYLRESIADVDDDDDDDIASDIDEQLEEGESEEVVLADGT